MKFEKLMRPIPLFIIMIPIYILILYLPILIFANIMSPSKSTRLNPDGFLEILVAHEILDLNKTRVNYSVHTNLMSLRLYLHDVEFTEGDVMAIADTMSLYFKSDEFIAFLEKNNLGWKDDTGSSIFVEKSIHILSHDSNRVATNYPSWRVLVD